MSEVFYLDIPRTRGSRGGYHPAPLVHDATPPPPPSPATGCQCALVSEGDGWHALRLVAGVVSVGCVLSVAARLWLLRQRQRQWRRHLSSRMDQDRAWCSPMVKRCRPCLRWRRLYHGGMDGIPCAREDRIALIEGDERQPEDKSPMTAEKGAEKLNANHHCQSVGGNEDNGNDVCSGVHGGGGGGEEMKCNGSGRGKGSSASSSSSSFSSSHSSLSLDSAHVFVTNTGERYRRVAQLGRGGFGTVFKCINLSNGQIVAVKEVRLPAVQCGGGGGGGGSSSNSNSADELRTEFELLSRIEHPNIIRLIGYHVGRRHARLFLEWAAGGSLRDMIRHVGAYSRGGGLDEDLVRSYVQQMLAALQCLHEHGIIHRDVKPQNMLIDHMGVLRVTDFGLSRLLSDEASAVETVVAGTPRYMAPETVKNGRFSCGSDLWAVGATMSELLTGRLPWSHLQPAVLQQIPSLLCHICRFPEEHPVIPSHVSEKARDFMECCFKPDPKDRGTACSLLQHPFLMREKQG